DCDAAAMQGGGGEGNRPRTGMADCRRAQREGGGPRDPRADAIALLTSDRCAASFDHSPVGLTGPCRGEFPFSSPGACRYCPAPMESGFEKLTWNPSS